MQNRVSYSYDEHLVEQQARMEEHFLTAFESAQPCLADAHVIVNPYGISPLSALILFKTSDAVHITITVHGKKSSQDNLVHNFDASTSHMIPVLGLYEDYANTVTITLSNGEERTFTIKTEAFPQACHCTSMMSSADYMGDNFMFLTPARKNNPSAFDCHGNLRWLLTAKTLFALKRLANGNILTGSPRFCRLPYFSSGLFEMNLLGKVYKEYRMPGYYHHDQIEMPDGNLLALSQNPHSDTVEDMAVLLDRETGKVLKTWDFKDFLPQNVAGSGSQDAHDWFHNNAVWYDEKTQSLTLSGRHQDAIVNIDYETSKLNWIIGDPEGWPQDMVEKYFFTPVGDVAKFDWQYEQHGCMICPDGSVMAFDNGQYRAKSKDKYIKNKDNFSRGVRYRIDTEKMEIEQLWQYGKELGQNFFSPYICNVDYYADGHYMVHSGGIAYVNGIASETLGSRLPEKDPSNHIVSRTIEEKDGVVMFAMEVEGNFYRANKMTMYHEGPNLVLGKGCVLGDLDVSPFYDFIPEVENLAQLPPAEHGLHIVEEEDRILLTATFEPGTLAMLIMEHMEDQEQSRAYFINTAKAEHIAMCSGVFLEKDPRTIKQHISKRELSGSYQLKLLVNDVKYSAGVIIHC